MKVFDTISKKLAIPVFVLFAIGWTVYTAGFGLVLNGTVESSGISTNLNFGTNHPFYFPYYFTLAGGPFVVVLGILHAALPSNQASAIVGILSTILNNIYFVSVGSVLSYTHLFIQPPFKTDNSLNLMFSGAILLTVSWSFSQILAIFFKQPQQTQSKNWWVLIVDIYKVLTSSDSEVWARFGRLFTFTEVIRLLSIPAVALSAIGWGVFVGGLHNVIQAITEIGNSISIFNNFAIWSSVIITPFGFLIALLHAGSSGSETIFGSLVSILNSFIIVCVGYVVTYVGQVLYINAGRPDPFLRDLNLMFGGGIIFLLFWTAVLTLSRFYMHSISCRADSTSNQLQLSPSQHDTTLNNFATPQPELQLTADPPPAYDYKQPLTVQQDNNKSNHYVAV